MVLDHLTTYHREIDMLGLKVSHIIEMLKFCLENIILRVNDSFYRQESGVGTGYYSSVAYASIILQKTLEHVINDRTPLGFLCVYVDDCYGLWNGTMPELLDFVQALSSIWPNLKFIPTFEDSQKSVIFLDLTIHRTDSGFITKFYRKDTHSGTYLHYSSHCPMVQKINIVKNETRRIITNCSIPSDAEPHLKIMESNLLSCGYPPHFIKKYMDEAKDSPPNSSNQFDPKVPLLKIPYISEAFTRIIRKELKKSGINAVVIVKSSANIRRQYHRASPISCTCEVCELGIPCSARHVIYRAECKTCSEAYIGVTTRPFKMRAKEHERDISNWDTDTAFVPHLTRCSNPERSVTGFKWSILDRGAGWKDSFFREAAHINSHNPKINRTKSGWIIT